ncbi:PREDICTED: RUN and FYVE domain-containing protein 4 [Elephantulus edwardii]|uniref:RUN and FYVE domain-containing protein 4 n=1 Tax=Elephantulus edwardii TaxID=28737 RepID=UPI0003F0A60D|nr:PREDICTED: RUN and FYVE domain-containing protein 4 [Elephantulus edwardii]
MADERAVLKITRDLKAAVSAIIQGYGERQQSVTDASAELHRLCGCLELLLQFDQKQQKSFLGPRKDYWDFAFTALRQQRGNSEPTRYACAQDKLKTSLGKGRAFIRFCLVHGQLAECLQLCLLNPDLVREWYGPQSPLVRPELQEDILDSLYALNGVAFDLDLQRADLDGAWPMFSESCCSDFRQNQRRRPRRTNISPQEISATCGDPKGIHQEEAHPSQANSLGVAPRENNLEGLPGSQPHKNLLPNSEKKREDVRSPRFLQSMLESDKGELQQVQSEVAPRPGICLQNSTLSTQGLGEVASGAPKATGTEAGGRRVLPRTDRQSSIEEAHEGEAEWGHVQRLLASSLRPTREEAALNGRQELEVPKIPGDPWVLQCLGKREEGSTTEKPQEQTGGTRVESQEEQAESPLQDLVKNLRHQLQKAKEQIQQQEQLLREQEVELKVLQGQLSSCHEERTRLQTELAQKHQEAEARDAAYQEELEGQRELVRTMKRRVLELIQEKDNLWQKVQHLSAVSHSSCVNCSKIFGRLSRRYPCRLCGGLVCHACSMDYKKRECCCLPCAQRGHTKVT